MRTATPASFCFPFPWNIFFHALTFRLYMSWGLKWFSCKLHLCGSCFCIHSAVCLLIGAFNPFTFKVIQFSQSCLTLCDPMNHSTPGLTVHHQLLESTETHAHQVDEAIQPSHPLSSPSPPALNLSQHQGPFQ